MAEKKTPPQWRLDAVALTLLAVGGVMTAAVASSRAFSGGQNFLDLPGELIAAVVVEPLGWGAVAFLAGWFAVSGLFVVSRSPVRIAVRVVGWAILSLAAATAVDCFSARIPFVAIAGPGGAIGAILSLNLQDYLDTPWDAIAIAAAAFLGLMLAADWLVIATARTAANLFLRLWNAAVWGNAKVAAGSDQMLAGLGNLARAASAKAPAHDGPDVIPITHPHPLPLSEARPAIIPIHSHAEGMPQLRAVPAVADDEPAAYDLPSLALLNDPEPFPVENHEQKLRDVAILLERTFTSFGLAVRVVGIHTGPVITQYEIALETGLRLNKVTNLADDVALNLSVPSVRVVAPLPGRNTVGIEVPNEIRQTVRLKELVTALAASPKVAKARLPIFLGKDVEGRPLAYDLHDMPHLLIAGRTGTGKSVCLNTIILSLLLTRRPDECRMILIDPKKVELSDYAHIPHLMTPVVKDEKKADAILSWAVEKMEERYEWLHRARVRKISAYNELPFDEIVRRINPDTEEERKAIPRQMPY
ncbi:MAG TPA: DNA translocase FtsK, partial [Gemmataceae bacterium]